MARPAGNQGLVQLGVFAAAIVMALHVWATDDGRHAHSPLKSWFDTLKNARGDLCCAMADGIADPDWETHDGHYRVRLDGEWIDVPEEVVLKVPNRFGRTMVWPSKSKPTFIRCFLPGSMI